MQESTYSPRRLAAKVRGVEAMKLRIAGASYREIAERLGYCGPGSAYKAVTRGLEETRREPAYQLRTLEAERMDAAQQAIWPKVRSGDLRAIDTFIRLSQRRAALLGLDASSPVTTEDVVWAAEAFQRLLAVDGADVTSAEVVAEAERTAAEKAYGWKGTRAR